MLKFFRRSKSKNTPNNNNTGIFSKNSKNDNEENFSLKTFSNENYNKSTCVLSQDINKIQDPQQQQKQQHENLNKFENTTNNSKLNSSSKQNVVLNLKEEKISPLNFISVDDHRCDDVDDKVFHNDDQQQQHQQKNQKKYFSPCINSSCKNTTKFLNTKECHHHHQQEKCKSSKLKTITQISSSSRNEFVDQTSCRFDKNVPSKGSIYDIDQSTVDQQKPQQKSPPPPQQQQQQQQQQKKDKQLNNKDHRYKKFNPINKSREFFYDIIMAKGRNRNRNRNNNNNNQSTNNSSGQGSGNNNYYHISDDNNHQQQFNQEQHNKQEHHHHQQQDQNFNIKNSNNSQNLINKQDENIPSKNLVEVRSNNERNNYKNINENLTKSDECSNEKNTNSELFVESDENFCSGNRIGYQITKSKNSTNLVMMRCVVVEEEEEEEEEEVEEEKEEEKEEVEEEKEKEEEEEDENEEVDRENDDENNETENYNERRIEIHTVDDGQFPIKNVDYTAVSDQLNSDNENLANRADANHVDLSENGSNTNSSSSSSSSIQQINNNHHNQKEQNDCETSNESIGEYENITDTSDEAIIDDEEDSLSDSRITQNSENLDELQNSDEENENEKIIVVEGSKQDTSSFSESLNTSKDEDDENDENDDDENDFHKKIMVEQLPQNENDDQFLNKLICEKVEKISELTECDRDCYIESEMGQPNSKSDKINNFSDNDNNNKNNLSTSNCNNNKNNGIVIPTITVADFSDQTKTSTATTINYCNSEIETDIFYDSAQTFDQFLSPKSIPVTVINNNNINETVTATTTTTTNINITDLEDVNDNENDDDDEWHFVSSNDNEHVTIEDDNDPFENKITYKNLNNVNNKQNFIRNNAFIDDTTISYNSLSSTTTVTNASEILTTKIINEKQSESPDSGIGRSLSSSVSSSSRVLLIDTSQLDCDEEQNLQQQQQQQQQHQQNQKQEIFLNSENHFVRGNSTDCDENLLQSDYETYFDDNNQQTSTTTATEQEKYYLKKKQQQQQQKEQELQQQKHHILIDSISLPDVVVESTGMGNSQSIPIDDKTPIIQRNTSISPTSSPSINSSIRASSIINDHNDNETRDLVNQEARFSAQLEDAQKIAYAAQSKVNDLQQKIDDLEKELSVKSWNVDRLQAELKAAQKEDECVRKKLKILEEEKENIRHKFSETEDDLNKRYEDLQAQYQQLQDKYENLKFLTNSLKAQLSFAQSDAKQCRLDKEQLQKEKDEEIKNLKEALEKSQEEHKALEVKWHKQFETLRTQNANCEEQLISDCEWKMRTMQKSCKEKLEKAEKERKEALEHSEKIEIEAKQEMDEVKHLKSYEAEVRQLRGLTAEQRESINSMNEQIEELREELENANEKVEEQIATVRKIRTQCENALNDKDRQMIKKIDEARSEISLQWEEKLLTEMTRLKTELEVVSVEDRQDIIQRLNAEHVEDIKALTVRYNANEQELKEELESLREKFFKKDEEFRELKKKSEEFLLESRLQLEKADRDYQYAMNREEEKKERLMENLNEEFKKEKAEMEEQFRERLGQVKDEFAKELSAATEELAIQHRKQLERQWEQLIADKEEALQQMESRFKLRLEEAEIRIKNLEIEHQRDKKEMKTNFEIERTTLESRDLQNSQEIEQLHRKCRCLTNLFEEMRMRYERRDPRPEDLREISELRGRCEEQERDLQLLTERLREMQIEMQEQQQQQQQSPNSGRKVKVIRKPPVKNIPISCDVIYEENEENESSPPSTPKLSSDNENNEKLIINGTTTM